MVVGKKIERRTRSSLFKLKRSTLLQMPPRVAIPLLAMALLLAAMGDYLTPRTIWFGPVYLLVIAFAAWAGGRRRAIGLGLFVVVVNLLIGNGSEYPYGPNSTLLNFSFRVIAVVGIVVLLGTARRALEKEWRLARTDQLTGALNRQAFFEAISTNEESPSWSVLIYADLDGLKRVNDTLGHKHGDASIIAFAKRVRSAIRKDDLFARMGGDEFVILMNVRDEDAGMLVADRLNRVLNVDLRDDETRLLSSLGVLILRPGARSIDMELKAADTLMYEAKRTKIGMLLAEGQVDDRQIVLSRHLAYAPPVGQKSAVRSRTREIDAAKDLAELADYRPRDTESGGANANRTGKSDEDHRLFGIRPLCLMLVGARPSLVAGGKYRCSLLRRCECRTA